MPTLKEDREAGRILAEKFASNDPVQVKEAASTIDRFIRRQFTEQSFMDKIIEPIPIGPDDLHQSLRDDKLYVLLELEPDLPGVASYAFNSVSPMVTMGLTRVEVSINQIRSVRMKKNVHEMLTHYVSLRDLNADYLLKQVLRHFDGIGLACIQRCIGQKPGQVMTSTGSVHYHEVQEGLTPHSLAESRKYIPRLGKENGLQSQTLLMNTVTFQDFGHWQYQQTGPTIATDLLKNGLSQFEDGMLGLKVISTIKRRLVPDGAVYHFGDPKYIGQNYVWREPTLHVSQMDDAVSFYVDAMRGGAIFFHVGLVRVDHKGV
jgi:hypothetical protein